MKAKILIPLVSLLLVGCSSGGTTSVNSSSGTSTTSATSSGGSSTGSSQELPPDPKEVFLRAKANTYENSVYEYTYALEAKIKFAGAVNFSPANLSGTIQYDKNAQETQYMHVQNLTGALVFDYTTYTYNVGTDLIKINANENKDFSIVNNQTIPSNYDFETNSVGFILKTLEDNGNLSVKKTSDKYELALKTNFKNQFLSILNKIDSQKILNALNDLTEEKWGVGFSCSCYAKLDSTNTKVSDFHFGVGVNVKDAVEISLTFDQHFSKIGSDVKITLPTFESTLTKPDEVSAAYSTLSTALNNSKPDYYEYNVHTKVDHGVSKSNPLGLGVDSTSQGYAERQIIGNEVYFHNGLELDSDYKNKDQYPDQIEDYKLTRAKVNNTDKEVYDVEDGIFKNTYTKLEDYNNDVIDDYYMLPETSWTANDTKIIRKTTKSGKDTYKLGLTTNGIKTLLEKYNKSIRLDKEGEFQLDVYQIASGFEPRKSSIEYVVSNNLVETITMHTKGFYVLSSGKQVKFEFDVEIEFDHSHKAYVAPENYKDIELPNY